MGEDGLPRGGVLEPPAGFEPASLYCQSGNPAGDYLLIYPESQCSSERTALRVLRWQTIS